MVEEVLVVAWDWDWAFLKLVHDRYDYRCTAIPPVLAEKSSVAILECSIS